MAKPEFVPSNEGAVLAVSRPLPGAAGRDAGV